MDKCQGKLHHIKDILAQNRNILEVLKSRALEYDLQIGTCESDIKKMVCSQEFYKKAIDIIYLKSITELENIINSALSFIFVDKPLEVSIELNDKHGKSLLFVIKHNGKKVSLKRGMGMGVKCVISAILHIYYLQCKNSKVLFLDEAYSNISEEYLSNFFDFLGSLCKKLDFTLVLITHDQRFIPYGDRVYQVSDGLVRLLKEA